MWSRGDRGGQVYVVTNLNDSGPGSLREAVEASGPRIVVFNVSGVIRLNKMLNILNPYITIAGQTVPGDGITITHRRLRICTNDVILRYLRVRLDGDREEFAQDCITMSPFPKKRINVRDVIVDHASTSWSSDEGISTNHDVHNVTVQNCIIAENLGGHGFGSIIASYKGNISYCNNLYISNNQRHPRIAGWTGRDGQEVGTLSVEFRNNVIYNWEAILGMNGNYNLNDSDPDPNYTIEQTVLINNYYRPGPNSNLKEVIIYCREPNSKLYLAGNSWDGKPVGWEKVTYKKTPEKDRRKPEESDVRVDLPPFKINPHRVMNAQEAYEYVLAHVGHSLRRDDVDKRLIGEVRVRAGSRVSDSSSIPPWKKPEQSKPWIDSNGNNIPDWWHVKYGLAPKEWLDPSGDLNGSGYTNIEEYLNRTDPTKFIDYTDLTNNV